MSQLLHKQLDGKTLVDTFRHDTLIDYFLAEYFAKKINSGELSVKEAYLNHWSYPEDRNLWNIKDMKKEDHALLPAWKPVIYFMLDMLDDLDDFVLKLNNHNPHLAARCVGRNKRISDETVKKVVFKLKKRLSVPSSYEAFLAVESLGETISELAAPILINVFESTKFYFGRRHDMAALAKTNSYSALEALYNFIIDPKIITGRNPPYKFTALRAMENYTDPRVLSEFLFHKFENDVMYHYWLFCEDRFHKCRDEIESYCWYISGKQSYADPIMKAYAEHIDNPYSDKGHIPSFDPDECPRLESILELMLRGATKDVVNKIIEYASEEETKSWRARPLKKVLSHLNKLSLEELIADEEKKIKTVNINGRQENLYQVYTEKRDEREIAYLYFDIAELVHVNTFNVKLISLLYEAKLVSIADSSQSTEIKSIINMIIWEANHQGITKIELSPENNKVYASDFEHELTVTNEIPEKRLNDFLDNVINDGFYFKIRNQRINQLKLIKQGLIQERQQTNEDTHAVHASIIASAPETDLADRIIYSCGYENAEDYLKEVSREVIDVDAALNFIKDIDTSAKGSLAQGIGAMLLLVKYGKDKNGINKINQALNDELPEQKKIALANAIAIIQEKIRPAGYKPD